MGNFLAKEPPPPVVLVPPLFDFPPLSARNRMLEPSYNLLFGKLALKCLFEDYFEDARQFSAKFLLKPIDDPHVDLVASLSGALDRKAEGDLLGNALFRWQSDVDDPHTFVDLSVSTSNPVLLMRSSAYYPKYGVGAFAVYPLLSKKAKGRVSEECMAVGFNNSIGDFVLDENKDTAKYSDLRNWSCAAGYGVGSRSPLSPSFNFGLELARSSQFIASFYQHVVVQRRVKNPFEEDEVVGITNYIDLGFELQTRVDDSKASDNLPDSSLQMAASWQANKNFLLKGKVGALSSTLTLAFKSWWKPSFAFNISATTNHSTRETAYGFGLRVDNIREASYQRADPNFVMLTPNKEHLADGIVWKMGKRPMFQSDLDAENFSELPKELRPPQKIL
ncbi:hypothetical protein F2Q68_00036528 [Brassica cretica]|uniref:Bacterial surface antigen (D15) domain-containing protein n=2 Tax=Brassica cretica TaxID=69181 RepID=A0ABQ7EMV4_BRACR|nr:hypothetical protein F2Q68_00036528 [Brassica cretica]KAF3597670.1 hypothetical protein DY000_02025696 [Brassica cretica]